MCVTEVKSRVRTFVSFLFDERMKYVSAIGQFVTNQSCCKQLLSIRWDGIHFFCFNSDVILQITQNWFDPVIP